MGTKKKNIQSQSLQTKRNDKMARLHAPEQPKSSLSFAPDRKKIAKPHSDSNRQNSLVGNAF